MDSEHSNRDCVSHHGDDYVAVARSGSRQMYQTATLETAVDSEDTPGSRR
jgi:hypothetical protein